MKQNLIDYILIGAWLFVGIITWFENSILSLRISLTVAVVVIIVLVIFSRLNRDLYNQLKELADYMLEHIKKVNKEKRGNNGTNNNNN